MRLGELSRLLKIQQILFRHQLYGIVFAANTVRIIKILSYLLPYNWFSVNRCDSRGVRLRCALEELGPIFVKFGQVLSTRSDLIPEDILLELIKLQDAVPPFPFPQAKRIIEEAFGQNIDDLFLQFSETPLASASIAQVHVATRRDGREIVVKVIRPNIAKIIRRDIALMYCLAKLLEQYHADAKKLCLVNVVSEFEKVLLSELDLTREAANASQLKRNFLGEKNIYIPEVYWDMTHKNVLVMERISGIQINDIDALKANGVDLQWLAKSGIEIFFTEVLRDSFFHADMHPGNIFIAPSEHGQPAKIIIIDFGIMGSLSEFDQRYLAENFMAFLERDYRKVAQLHIESGWVPNKTRVDEFESAIRTVCEPLFDRPLKEISLGNLLLHLFQTARQFDMVILPQLLLLQKTLVNIEGLGRQLDPEIDIWETAQPVFERWINNRISVKRLIKGVQGNLPRWLDSLPDLPHTVIDILNRLHDGDLQLQVRADELKDIRSQLVRGNKRTVLATSGSAFMICATIILGLEGFSLAMFAGIPYLTWLFGSVGLVLITLSMT